MAIGLKLYPVHAARLHAFGGIGIILNDPLDIPVFHLFGKRPMGGFAFVRWRYDRQPVSFVPTCTPTQMGELDHHRGTLFVDGVGHVLHPWHDLILINQKVVENRWAVFRYGRRPRRHGHCHPTLCTLHMIGAVAFLWHAILRICRFVGCHDDAIAKRKMLKLIRLKKRVFGHLRNSNFQRAFLNHKNKCTLMSILRSLVYISKLAVLSLLAAFSLIW